MTNEVGQVLEQVMGYARFNFGKFLTKNINLIVPQKKNPKIFEFCFFFRKQGK